MDVPIFTADARFEPWWWEAAPRPAGEAAMLPSRADVAIVGGGFTGVSAALELARAGRAVVLLEAGDLGRGASSRNGGMIGSGMRIGFGKIGKRYGEAMAEAVIKEGLAALDFTGDLIEREGIRCHFKLCGRFRGAWRPQDYEAMGPQSDLLRGRFGIEVDMVSPGEVRNEVATDAYHGGCIFHGHGGLHPGLLHLGLLDLATAAGAIAVGNRPVSGVSRDGDGFRVRAGGESLFARDVIVATHGYTGRATPAFRRRLVPVPNYVIATEDLGAARIESLFPSGRMIVESRARHCYYRPAPDGRRVVFGGRAAVSAIDTRTSARRLYDLLIGIFPQLEGVKISHSWDGLLGMSRDGLPHIGKRDGLHYALGYGGEGVAMAPYLGWKAARKVLGKADGKSPFDGTPFPAVPFYNGWPWFLPLIEPYYRYLDRRQGSA